MDDTSTALRELSHIKDLCIGLSRAVRTSRRDDAATTLIRALVVAFLSHDRNNQVKNADIVQVANARYPQGQAQKIIDVMQDLPAFVARATTQPAQTTVAGWAAELAQQGTSGIVAMLAPKSTYAALAARGLRLSFAGIGTIKVLSRGPANISGVFVGEAAGIPVRALSLAATSIAPCAAKVISIFTAELSRRSTPSIEAVIRQAIAEDTAAAIDGIMMGASAPTAVSPGGLLNGVTPLAATAGGSTAALSGDLGKLAGAVAAPQDLIYLMPEAERVRALTLAPGLIGVTIISTPSLAAKSVVALDAADFLSGETDTPSFDVTSQATLVTADSVPVDPFGTTPTSSLWQQDLIGIRALFDCTWAMRMNGRIATITGVTW